MPDEPEFVPADAEPEAEEIVLALFAQHDDEDAAILRRRLIALSSTLTYRREEQLVELILDNLTTHAERVDLMEMMRTAFTYGRAFEHLDEAEL